MPDFRFHTFFDAAPEVNFSGGDTADWIWIADPIFRHRQPVLPADHHRPGVSQHDVRRHRRRLADEDPRHGHDDPRPSSERDLQRRGPAPSRSRAATGSRSTRRRSTSPRSWRPRRWLRRSRSSGRQRTRRRRGRRRNRSRLRLEERRRGAGRSGDVDAARLARDERPEPVRERHLRRSGEREPRLGVVLGLRRHDADDSRARVRGHVQPGAGTATWVEPLSIDLGDLPINDVVLDPQTGDVYASNDFGVPSARARRTRPGRQRRRACRTSRSPA